MNRIVANSLCNGGISEDNEVKQDDVGLTFSKDMSKDRTAFYEEEAVIYSLQTSRSLGIILFQLFPLLITSLYCI